MPIPSAVAVRPIAKAVFIPAAVKASVPSEMSTVSAERSFALLTGESVAARPDSSPSPVVFSAASESPAPLPPSSGKPEAAKAVRRMMVGTTVMKAGMETMKLSMPLLALQAFGGVSAVAGLIVAHGLAQAGFAGMAGSLSDRFSARKVLAGAVATQAVLITTLLVVGLTGALSGPTMIPLYLLIGGVSGVIETVRHSIPALIVGKDEESLKKYNAKLHIWYEVAGVGGALAAGGLLATVGPVWALALMPPAYLAAAWFYSRVRHDNPTGPTTIVRTGIMTKIRAYFADIKAGAKIIVGDQRLRWVGLALVAPQIVHRVFEDLLIPVFAKKVLLSPESSAWMVTASNMGELVGAAVLLRLASRFKGSASWVKWGAIGLTLIWALAFSKSLIVLLPLVLLSSATWSSADLSLRSEVQRAVPEKDQPRAMSFLYGSFVLGGALTSLALGAFIDSLPLIQAIMWTCAIFSTLAAGVFFASRKLKR